MVYFPVLPHSEPSSCSASPALSTDSLSSSSDHSSSQLLNPGRPSGEQLPVFTKSVSEPSICSPSDPASSPSSSERLPRASQGLHPAAAPSNATSAPATPQTGRSSGTGAPSVAPGPPASGGTQSHNKVSLLEIKPYSALQKRSNRNLWSFRRFSGAARRTPSTEKPPPPLPSPVRGPQRALVLPDPQPPATASLSSNAR